MHLPPRYQNPVSLKPAIAGALAMALAMGIGRFAYTPILPLMISGLDLSASDAGIIASANFAGYLAGAVLAGHGWATGRERQVALAALAVTILMLVAMPLFDSITAFSAIRFLAGGASAFAMIFTTSIVLGLPGSGPQQQAVHFGGVGIGIAISSLLVVVAQAFPSGFDVWREAWLIMAAAGLAAIVVIVKLLPKPLRYADSDLREPPLSWRIPLLLITVSYGLFGFGYVITATFLVTIARDGASGPFMEFACWFVTGIAAAVSLFFWRLIVARWGLVASYIFATVVEAAGVFCTVALPVSVAPISGGILFGGTFIMITAIGLQVGRQEASGSPRKALATMTAAFGTGQMVGPVIAGWIAEITGDFRLATIAAAVGLIVVALLAVPLLFQKVRQ